MTVTGDELLNFFRVNAPAATPRGRLQSHREYWGDDAPPEIMAKMDLVQRLIDEKKAPNKRLLLLAQLDSSRNLHGWNTDPDTIRGEKQSIDAQKAGESPKKKDWAIKLANDLLKKTDNFEKAWKKINEHHDYSDELPVRKETKNEKEGIEYLEGAHPFLTKSTFRTEYFQPAKREKNNKSEE